VESPACRQAAGTLPASGGHGAMDNGVEK